MVDFKKLSALSSKKLPATLLEAFSRLDRQVSHVELRPSQIKILEMLDGQITQRDLVVKLNTGGGKTTIGLLYLKYKLDQLNQPTVFLVPTVQLVDQVIAEGRRIGITVLHWASGESYPPEEALRGKAVIACTYDKFFNGRSTFARADVMLVPGAIVLDDVHAGIESIRKCFGCDIPSAARDELIALLGSDLADADPGAWTGIDLGDHRALLEVPHWVIAKHVADIRRILAAHADTREIRFAWPHISSRVELCRLVLSGAGAHIALDPPTVGHLRHYVGAGHRLFMSASIHDGAVLIRELDCDPTSAACPVQLGGEMSEGERMVLAPSLIDPEFTREELKRVATAVREHANVVVLASSFQEAEDWEDVGAIVATNSTIADVINQLKAASKGILAVFVQRYDGIDLPDKACRLLIIDGLPSGESLLDRSDMQLSGGVVGVRGKVANRLEQGLGRAVRSASDYCAVILAGRDVAGFVSRAVVLENFSPLAVRQMEIGRAVSEALAESKDRAQGVVDTVMQCLRRDPDWKDYYSTQMSVESSSLATIGSNADRNRKIAAMERSALRKADGRDYVAAAADMQRASDECKGDRALRGILKQTSAKYQYYAEPIAAMRMQASAYADNSHVSRPPTLLPADVRKVTGQAESISRWLSGFSDPNGALIEIDDLRSRLSFARKASDVEAAIRDLGELLGAESLRPDHQYGRGPDNLWIFDDVALAIEMKSEKVSALSKGDAEQLQSSLLWVGKNFAGIGTVHALIGSNIDRADQAADFAFGAKVLAEVDFNGMLERLRRMAVAVATEGPLFTCSAANIQRFLGPNELLPSQLPQAARMIKQERK